MIQSFRCYETEKIFNREGSRRLPGDIQKTAYRKLVQIHSATRLETLAVPPANKLEALKRDRLGQHSVRINNQWRICFTWRDGHAFDVEITNYH